MPFGSLALLLIGIGALLGAPALLVIGLVLGVVEVLKNLWRQRGLVGVRYERELGTTSAVWGDEIPLKMTIWNRKLLPLAWITVEELVSEGVVVKERPTDESDRPGFGLIRNGWTLGPYERVERTHHIVAAKRGRYRMGPVRLKVSDLFAGGSQLEERELPAAYLVAPRSVAVRGAENRFRVATGDRPTTGFVEDPALFAGLRPYQPGDSMRHIHWKAAARTGQIRSKRFDSSREREMVIALDIQTLPGAYWKMVYDEDLVEALCVAAASIARDAIRAGTACGLAAAAFSESIEWQMRVPPARGPAQFLRIGNALARLSPFASGPFDGLLAGLPRWLARPATIIIVSGRDPAPYLHAMRRLARHGQIVKHVSMGPDAAASRDRVARTGIRAQVGRMSPDWQRTDALDLAG